MPLLDLGFKLTGLNDETTIDVGGVVSRVKRATFYLGRFGPFVERFPAEDYTADKLRLRADELRRGVEDLHR